MIVRKGLVACKGRVLGNGKVLCEDCLFMERRLTYDARAVTYTDMVVIARADIQQALVAHPAIQQRFRLFGLKRLFRDEVVAYAKAFVSLRDGVQMKLDLSMDERPLHYYKRLQALYGSSGLGLRNPKAHTEERIHAAMVVQRYVRGWMARTKFRKLARRKREKGTFTSLKVPRSSQSTPAVPRVRRVSQVAAQAAEKAVDTVVGSLERGLREHINQQMYEVNYTMLSNKNEMSSSLAMVVDQMRKMEERMVRLIREETSRGR